jgi:hypothetical protein
MMAWALLCLSRAPSVCRCMSTVHVCVCAYMYLSLTALSLSTDLCLVLTRTCVGVFRFGALLLMSRFSLACRCLSSIPPCTHVVRSRLSFFEFFLFLFSVPASSVVVSASVSRVAGGSSQASGPIRSDLGRKRGRKLTTCSNSLGEVHSIRSQTNQPRRRISCSFVAPARASCLWHRASLHCA